MTASVGAIAALGPAHLAAQLPDGPAYTVVLICHVASVLVGLASVTASAVVAGSILARRRRTLAPSPAVRRYFSPGANWAGRALYLIPVFGAGLIAMSGGVYRLGSAWVVAGIVLWAGSIALGEWVLWPAEQAVARELAAKEDGEPERSGLRASCGRICASGVGVMVLVVAAMVVMVAKP